MRKAYCVLVLVGLLVACGGGKKGKGDLKATGSPTGKIEGQTRIIVSFDKPMVGKDKIDQVVAKPPIDISPKLEGEAKWSDDKTLVFLPSKTLPLSTKFVVTVPGNTKSLDGSSTGDAMKFEFFTERLRGVVEVVGSKLRAKKDETVKLAFNHEVAFDQIKAHCGFDGGGGRVGVKLAADSNAGPAKTYTIQPASDLKMN